MTLRAPLMNALVSVATTVLLGGVAWGVGLLGVHTVGPAEKTSEVETRLAAHVRWSDNVYRELLDSIAAVNKKLDRMDRREEVVFYAWCVDVRERTPTREPPTCRQ